MPIFKSESLQQRDNISDSFLTRVVVGFKKSITLLKHVFESSFVTEIIQDLFFKMPQSFRMVVKRHPFSDL